MRRVVVSAFGLLAGALVTIATFEGYRGETYNDVAGVPTIGWGTTEGVKPGDKTDPTRALIRLHADADRTARELVACIGDVPLYPHEWNAYVSWAYNVGTGAACGSTLVKKLRETPPDYAGACAELKRWVYAGGRRIKGLERRREAEYHLCMGEP